ncbi:FAD-dependent oxidoreductase [Streptomyces sp. NPDC001508]|uniref:NAD(P)/FAD-dependent oxidoreductase n=1 Tax=Streptomyces sp. NPDC001508 TaxID=3154656 RepID=UPI0033168D09
MSADEAAAGLLERCPPHRRTGPHPLKPARGSGSYFVMSHLGEVLNSDWCTGCCGSLEALAMSQRESIADYRSLSLWHDNCPGNWRPRPRLDGDAEADIVIVGAGYTGLWTAYHLTERDPQLRIVVVESEVAGFGASGRNGGWCSAIFPATLRKVARSAGRSGAVALQRAMNATIPEVGSVAAKEGIDCDFAQGGYISVARNDAQWARAMAEVETWRSWGFEEDHIRLLSRDEAATHLGATRVLGGTFTPHCAALHPAKLVRGLAAVVENRGVVIHERTTVHLEVVATAGEACLFLRKRGNMTAAKALWKRPYAMAYDHPR